MIAYRDALTRSAFDLPASLFERAERRASERCDALLAQARARDGSASTVFGLQAELSKLMNRAAGLDGEPPGLDELRQELDSLSTQLGSVRVSDASARLNQSALALRDMADRLLVARLVLESSAHRGEGPVRSAASDEPRLVLARYDDQEQTRFVDEFSYECCGRRVELASRIDSRGIALTDRADVGAWTIAASAG
jgi:succinate dehydrogenase/fumarate reductase flavoprotein subunit